MSNSFHYLNILHFIYLLMKFTLFLLFGYMNNAVMNICVWVFLWICVLISLWFILRSEIAGSYNSLCNILRKHHTVFQNGCTILHSYSVCKFQFIHILFSTCYYVYYFSHISNCEVVYLYGVDFHFSDGWWCWASFYVLIGHLYVSFGEMSNQSLCPF